MRPWKKFRPNSLTEQWSLVFVETFRGTHNQAACGKLNIQKYLSTENVIFIFPVYRGKVNLILYPFKQNTELIQIKVNKIQILKKTKRHKSNHFILFYLKFCLLSKHLFGEWVMGILFGMYSWSSFRKAKENFHHSTQSWLYQHMYFDPRGH